MKKHWAMITWLDAKDEPNIHIVSSVKGDGAAVRLAENWVKGHPQSGSLVNAKVEYLGQGPF